MKMRVFFFFVSLFFFFNINTTPVFAGGFTGTEFRADSTGISPVVNGAWGRDWGDFGLSAFVLITPAWAQAYAGPTWSPTDGLQLSLSAGMAQNDGAFAPRFATSVFFSHSDFSFLGIFEWGTGGVDEIWYKLLSKYQIAGWLSAGLELRRFAGFGPHVSVSIPETPLGLWLSWVPWDPEVGTTTPERTLFGVQLGF